MYAHIIACGATKLDTAAAAQDLYTSPQFKLNLAAVKADAAETAALLGEEVQVFILSALHGLVALTTVLDPYNLKMGQKGSITAEALHAQIMEAGISEITAFLPGAYQAKLEEAWALGDCVDYAINNVWDSLGGNGYQNQASQKAAAPLSYAAALYCY